MFFLPSAAERNYTLIDQSSFGLENGLASGTGIHSLEALEGLLRLPFASSGREGKRLFLLWFLLLWAPSLQSWIKYIFLLRGLHAVEISRWVLFLLTWWLWELGCVPSSWERFSKLRRNCVSLTVLGIFSLPHLQALTSVLGHGVLNAGTVEVDGCW